MRAVLALLLALSVALVSGCGATKPEPTVSTTGSSTQGAASSTTKPAEKIADPITITPDPGPLGSGINAKDGVDKQEAQVVGASSLVALREKRLGDAYGANTEEYTLLNQVKVQGEWLLTYSRTTVDKQPSDAYAATIVVDTKSGKQIRVTEAP